jgi:monovalent cation:H+ antiporter-2, CPA2 family
MTEGSLQLAGTLLKSLGRSHEEVAGVLDEFRVEAYARLTDLIPSRPSPTAKPAPAQVQRRGAEAVSHEKSQSQKQTHE